MTNVLIVAPHPDDAEIGCGGMIHARLAKGDKITVAVCAGPGDLRMVHSGQVVKFQQRKEEQKAALAVLGDVGLEFLDLAAASRFDEIPQTTFVTVFDRLFVSFGEVYLPLPSYNDDHTRVWKAGLAAFRPGKLDGVNLFAYEQPTQTHGEQVFGSISGKRYFPLTGTDISKKTKALCAHVSQMSGRDDTIAGAAGVTTLARLRGLEIGKMYAEMFYPIREIVKC